MWMQKCFFGPFCEKKFEENKRKRGEIIVVVCRDDAIFCEFVAAAAAAARACECIRRRVRIIW